MENTKIKFWGCGRLGTIGMAVLLSFALRAEDLSASPGSDASVTIDSIAAGTVTNFTTASTSDKWNCIAKRSSLSSTSSSANDYVTATVVRNADGTATVGIEVLYSIGDKVAVGVYKGSETSGSGTLVKTITFQKLAAEERTRTIAVGETLNEPCTFFKARNWACDITQSGTVVTASVNTASATSTALAIEGKAEGAATVTVSRTQSGSSKTATYVYHVTVTAGEPPEPPSEDEQPTDLSPATTAENPIALLTEAQTDYLYAKTIDERRTAVQGGQYAELFCYGSPVVLSWKETTGSCAVSVKRLSDNKVVWTGETAGTSVTVHNLELGAGYEWTVTSKTSGLSASATFYTSDLSPRLIQAGRMKNLRDLGGWTGLQGCKVRQNLLFRGGAADDPKTDAYLIADDSDRDFLCNVIGLKNEVDLRNIDSTDDVTKKARQSGLYKFDPSGEHVTYNNFSIANNVLPTNGNLVAALRLLMAQAELPAYFHCKSGRDRTGTVAGLLLAVLGVSRDDIVRDYQTTSDKDNFDRTSDDSTYHGGFKNFLDVKIGAYRNSELSLAENAKAYLMDCGFSDDEVEDFRKALLVDYERQGGETPPVDPPDDPTPDIPAGAMRIDLKVGERTSQVEVASHTAYRYWKVEGDKGFAVATVAFANGTPASDDSTPTCAVTVAGVAPGVEHFTAYRSQNKNPSGSRDDQWVKTGDFYVVVSEADEEALPSLTPEEEAKIAEVLSSSPDALLKASVTTIEDYTAYKAWVDAGVASGAIESEAAAKGAAGSFFSFATDQNRVVDPGEIDEEKVKVEEMKVNGGEVTLTVGIEDLPVGENAQKKYLEQVFGVTGTRSLEKNDFAAEKVVYKQDMVRNADGTVSYTVEPKVEEGAARPDEFYFKAKVSK